MTRAKDITEIIEGFKLGSLGAGTKKFVDPDAKPVEKKRPKTGKVKILKQGDEINFQPGLKWVLWEDVDSIRYSMFMEKADEDGHSRLHFLVGENLEYNEKTSEYKNYQIQCVSKDTDTWQGWSGKFSLYLHIIKKDGIKGLLENFTRIFRPVSGQEDRFQTWLRAQLLGLNK